MSIRSELTQTAEWRFTCDTCGTRGLVSRTVDIGDDEPERKAAVPPGWVEMRAGWDRGILENPTAPGYTYTFCQRRCLVIWLDALPDKLFVEPAP